MLGTKKKKQIDATTTQNIFFHEREIWWTCLGVNVGFEQDGKNVDFERPVLILKKFNAHAFLGVPLTSTVKKHKYYFPTSDTKGSYSIILSQVRLLSTKRLTRKIRRLPKNEFAQVVSCIKGFI